MHGRPIRRLLTDVLARVAVAETAAGGVSRPWVRRGPGTAGMDLWIPARKVVTDGGIRADMLSASGFI